MVKDIEFIEEVLEDYFHQRRIDIDNGCSISSAWYTKAYESLDNEQYQAHCAMERIKEKLGVA